MTESQIAALRAAATEEGTKLRDHRQITVNALRRRGLVTISAPHGAWVMKITPAGRHALFEATGENA